MDIILLKDVEFVGDKYDVVSVKNGYGRNYLIPKKLAVIANETNRTKLNSIMSKHEAEMAKRVDEFKAIAEVISGKSLTIAAKAGTSGKIFGSVTSIQIVQAIKEQMGVEVERKTITMPEEVKNLGSYVAVANLHKEVKVDVKFDVVVD